MLISVVEDVVFRWIDRSEDGSADYLNALASRGKMAFEDDNDVFAEGLGVVGFLDTDYSLVAKDVLVDGRPRSVFKLNVGFKEFLGESLHVKALDKVSVVVVFDHPLDLVGATADLCVSVREE